MYRITTLLLLLVSLQASAQLEYFNSTDYWKKFRLRKKTDIRQFSKHDTCIIVASNRAYQNDEVRFMSESVNCNGLNYFFIFANKGIWHVVPVTDLERAVSYMPNTNRDWVVYTEGMGKLFTNDIERGINMAGQYGVNVLLLDYPSIRTDLKRIPNYRFAIYQARNAYHDFAPALDTVKTLRQKGKMGGGKLSLFFHSMGNNVMSKIAENGDLQKLNDKLWVDNLILNAPCVQQKRHTDWLNKINFAKHIYVHYNPKDHTLQGAHLLSMKKQLGEKVKEPVCSKATYINFNALADRGHSNFLSLYGRGTASLAAVVHYNTLLHGDTVNVYDTALYNKTGYRKIGWDIKP